MKQIIFILIGCTLTVLMMGCDNNTSSTNKQQSVSNSSSITSSPTTNSSKNELRSGQSVTLKNDALVCSSKENENKLISLIREKKSRWGKSNVA